MNWNVFEIANNGLLHGGQKIVILDRLIEKFNMEHNAHSDGDSARGFRAELNDLIPSEYRGQRLIWLDKIWSRVLEGTVNPKFPIGEEYLISPIPENERESVTAKKNETLAPLRAFYKWQRNNHKPTVTRLFRDRHIAGIEGGNDDYHDSGHGTTIDDLMTKGVPSKNPNANHASNIAYLLRVQKRSQNLTEEQQERIDKTWVETRQQSMLDDYWDTRGIDLDSVRLEITMPEPPDPPEDFFTFTEVDIEGVLEINSSSKMTATDMARSDTVYAHKDKGVGNFTDYTQLLTLRPTGTELNGRLGFWATTNTPGTEAIMTAGGDVAYAHWRQSVGGNRLIVKVNGVTQNVIVPQTINTTRHLTIDKSGVVYSLDTYTDPDRTAHDQGDSLTHTEADTSYQHIQGIFNQGVAASATVSGWISDMDLQQAVGNINRKLGRGLARGIGRGL